MTQNILPDFDALWDYNHPAETAVRFQDILPRARRFGDTEYTIELLTQIARTQSLQDNFAEAHTILDEAEAMLKPKMPVPRIRYLLERGRTFNASGAPETAVPLFKKAYDLGLSLGKEADFFTVDAAHMLGIAMPTSEQQLKWNLIALELARASANEKARGWRGSLLNNVGWTYFDQEEFDKALNIFQEALAWRIENNPNNPELIRIAKWCVARTLRALDRIEPALDIQKALLAEIEASGDEQDGFVFEELGECYWALGETDTAQPYFAQAYACLSQLGWFVRGNQERLARLKRLGEPAD